MDPEYYDKWQDLHQRFVQGEMLSEVEQSAYNLGCREFDADECLDIDLVRLRELRVRIETAANEQRRLREREADLDAQIQELERLLDPRTRQALGVTG